MVEAGGGSKQTGTVRVTNNGSDQLAVIVDPSGTIQTSLAGGTLDASTFTSAGGQFIGPGGTAVFSNVRAGTHTVAAAFISGTTAGSDIGTVASTSVNVKKGQTINLSATESGTVATTGGAATLTLQ